MNNYYDHGQEQVCVICGEAIPQVEHESKNAELTSQGYICRTCQNTKSPETLQEYGLATD